MRGLYFVNAKIVIKKALIDVNPTECMWDEE